MTEDLNHAESASHEVPYELLQKLIQAPASVSALHDLIAHGTGEGNAAIFQHKCLNTQVNHPLLVILWLCDTSVIWQMRPTITDQTARSLLGQQPSATALNHHHHQQQQAAVAVVAAQPLANFMVPPSPSCQSSRGQMLWNASNFSLGLACRASSGGTQT